MNKLRANLEAFWKRSCRRSTYKAFFLLTINELTSVHFQATPIA